MHDFGGKAPGHGLPEEAPGQQRRPVLLHRQARAQDRQGRTPGRQRRRPDELRQHRSRCRTRASCSPPPRPGGKPTTFALPYAAGLVKNAPHSANAKKFLDYLLSDPVQQQVSAVGGGFTARKDIKATDANAIELAKIMNGVEVFQPDWDDIDKNLDSVRRRVEDGHRELRGEFLPPRAATGNSRRDGRPPLGAVAPRQLRQPRTRSPRAAPASVRGSGSPHCSQYRRTVLLPPHRRSSPSEIGHAGGAERCHGSHGARPTPLAAPSGAAVREWTAAPPADPHTC